MSRPTDSVLRARPVRHVPGQLPLWPEAGDEPDTATPEEPTENTTSTERTEQ